MNPTENRNLELAIIKAILVDPSCFDDVYELITENDFASVDARAVFTEAKNIRSAGEEFDLFILADKTGLEEFISTVTTEPLMFAENPIAAAKVLERESYKRKSLMLMADTQELIRESKDADEQEALINSLSEKLERKQQEFTSFNDLAKDGLARLDQRMKGITEHRLKTGFEQIDERIVGFAPSDFIIVAGRPAMGKTTYAMNIMENVALDGGNCLVFSLEMSKEQLIDRMLASLSGVDAWKIKTGKGFTDEELSKLSAGTYKMKKMNPIIIDTPAIDVHHASNIARKINRKQKLDLIVIDYLQLMRCKSQNRFEEISAISRQLKALAKLTKTPVIALSQLSRGVDSRTNNRPVNSDLRESGQIEQDADVIQFLYREEVYNSDSPNKGICEVITTKFRNGETGTDFLKSELSKNRFAHLDFRPAKEEKKVYKYGN